MPKALPTVVDGKIEVGFYSEIRNAYNTLIENRKISREADKRASEASKYLIALMNSLNAEVATIGGAKAFKLVHKTRTQPDAKLLQELFPEAFEATAKTSHYDQIDCVAI